MKKIISSLFICLALLIFAGNSNVEAAVSSATLRITGSYSGAYYFAFNLRYSFNYNSPGNGKVTYVAPGSISGQTCSTPGGGSSGCRVKPSVTRSYIYNNGGAAAYTVKMDFDRPAEIIGWIYMGSKTETYIISSPGPRSVPIKIHEEYYIDEDLVGRIIIDDDVNE